jgi:hypothetical protein
MALTRTIKINETVTLNHPSLKKPAAFKALISQPMGQYAPYLSTFVDQVFLSSYVDQALFIELYQLTFRPQDSQKSVSLEKITHRKANETRCPFSAS